MYIKCFFYYIGSFLMEKPCAKFLNKYIKLIENANSTELDISNPVIEILSELPFDIYDINRKLLNYTLEYNDLNNQIKSWESETLTKINEEVDEKDKKLYSNDTLRQAELSKRRVAIDAIVNGRNTIKDDISELENLVTLLRDIQNNYRNIALLVKSTC